MEQSERSTQGTVLESLPNDMFRVELKDGRKLLCHLPSGTRMRVVNILPGDRVIVEPSPYDSSRGRITELAR